MTTKMLGNLAVRCHYGCCRVYGHKTGRGYRAERRQIKRGERNRVKRMMENEASSG